MIIWEVLAKSSRRTTRFTKRTHSRNIPQLQKPLIETLEKCEMFWFPVCHRLRAVTIVGSVCQTTLSNRQHMSPSDVTIQTKTSMEFNQEYT